jgi:hypothetical protein
MLRLKLYPERSPNYQVRGTVRGVYVSESTGTANLELATEYMARRATEAYREVVMSSNEWTTISEDMIRVLLAVAEKANNRRMKRGGKEDRITVEFVTSLYLKQRGKCAVSGITFRLDELKAGKLESRAFAPSLDRIDNNIGYEPGNVRLVCRIANFAMNTWGDSALLELSLGVAAYWEAVTTEKIKGAKCVQRSLAHTDRVRNVQ